MSADSREMISWTLGTLISLSILAGLVARFVLLPWLKHHLVEPMQHVEKQVTENHHSNAVPTVLDRIDDVQQSVQALGRVIDGHMEWSERWVDLMERELKMIRDRKEGQ